jgi:pimeloyl-ACP methyl ester carboxylesterase
MRVLEEANLYCRSKINVLGGTVFCRHTEVDSQRPTLLCIHGLGDSGLVFCEAFYQAGLRNFNLVVPDLLGYGKSSRAADDDYGFHKQIARLYQLLEILGIAKFTLLGHSMGGDIGTLMCANDGLGRIQAFANLEGDLTEGDRFITTRAIAAEKAGAFEGWLRHCYTEEIVPDALKDHKRTCRRYQASVRLCKAEAFLQNAKEIYGLNENHLPHQHGIIASIFDSLPIRKKFYWAKQSLHAQSQKYLEQKSYSHTPPFEGTSHWIMLDQRREFYDVFLRFLQGEE